MATTYRTKDGVRQLSTNGGKTWQNAPVTTTTNAYQNQQIAANSGGAGSDVSGSSGGSSGGSATYALGAWGGDQGLLAQWIPNVPLADVSPSAVFVNLEGALRKKFGPNIDNYVIQLARTMSKKAVNNISTAKSVITGSLSSHPNALLEGSMAPGSYDTSTGKSTPVGVIAPNSTNPATVGVTNMAAQGQVSAYAQVYQDLDKWGLTQLAPFVWDQISATGDMKGAATVVSMVRQTPEYAARFPGNAQKIAAGQTPIDETTYDNTVNGMLGAAQNFGVPTSGLTPQFLGNLIANNNTVSDFTNRVQYGYALANSADANVKQALAANGVTPGATALYYLDPKMGMDAIYKQNVTAYTQGYAKDVGFGNVDKATAEQIASLYPLNTGAASMADVNAIKGKLSSVTPLVPLETAQIGQTGQAKVSQTQLLSQAFTGMNQASGTTAAGDAAAIKLAQQARTAGMSGGGGFASDAKGVVGLGSASTAGTGRA
jgi:hypothetical protein